MHLERNVDLRTLNTFGVAARAPWLGRFRTVDDLRALVFAPELQGQPRLVLGGGSNILFTQDPQGVVLLNELPGIAVVHQDDEFVWVRSGAGVVWHELVLHTVAQGWGGLENLSLIPGKVGAAPMQNIGAYGVEIKDTFDHLEALRVKDGEVQVFRRGDCLFGYRESFFKREGRERFVILNVTFKLKKRPEVHTTYGAIQDVLAQRNITAPTIQDVSEAVIQIRRSKLPDPAVLGNAGSFFKNPVVPQVVVDRIKVDHPKVVSYPASPGEVKLAAGWLIEQAGWKGFREGPCGVHKDQALVLVNHGGATGSNIFDLSTRILESVKQRFGVELEREVNII